MTAAGEAPGRDGMPGEPEPDAVAQGWVVPPGGSRVDAIFVLAGTSLGIGRAERTSSTVWLDLQDLMNLDAIGEPVDGLTAVEILMADRRVIGAGWPDEFCAAVVDALRVGTAPVDDQPALPDPPAHGAHVGLDAPPTPAPEAADGAGSGPTADAAPPVAPAGTAPAPGSDPGTALELEDVVYLGGYPGQSKRRKKCVVGMSRAALELKGPSDLHVRIGWDSVRTIEVQNSDEARFRMNTKVHRDASALVVECQQGVTVLLEARDCPTIALRSAIAQLLDGLPVVVV